MSLANPTPIRLGMAGEFFGKNYRVVGRVVMSMVERGTVYYWQEFNLLGPEAQSAILVYEPADHGGDWRLFAPFDPSDPLSAERAASQRVGNRVAVDGEEFRVTLVARSRVCLVEGQGTEGEDVGHVADYFNAQQGNTLLVVSWTGNEVEFFRGQNLSAPLVRKALNVEIPLPRLFRQPLSARVGSRGVPLWSVAVGAGLIGLLLILFFSQAAGSGSRPRAVTVVAAPTSALRVGASGFLNGQSYRLQAHSLVETAEPGLRSLQHEYELVDDAGNVALLVHGWNPGANDWVLFSPREPPTSLSPPQAAAKRAGEVVSLSGYSAPVRRLFSTTVRRTETVEATNTNPGITCYGFSGQTGAVALLVRWREDSIGYYAGRPVLEKEIREAFQSDRGHTLEVR
jgi:hypothetical protein